MTVPGIVGVYGGGRMGGGIAHAFLAGGSRVVVVEATTESADEAYARISESLHRAAERGTLASTVDETLGRLTTTPDVSALVGADIVVEAVPEDVAIKRSVFTAVEQVAPDAWLATNTSSLSVDSIADGTARPERLIGLHFFNPVPASTLIEIVVGPRTAPELVPLAQSWIAGLGKTAIIVTDSPGFASSRLGVAIALEAMRMLEEGVASAEDIDTAMTLGYKHPVGPLKTTDIVGLDVRLAIAEHLERELGARFRPPAILRDLVDSGRLGRKAGQGFYTW